MRWRPIALIAFLPLAAVQVAHSQNGAPQPTCALACQVNPFTAPASCDCNAPNGEPVSEAPVDPPPQTQPVPPVVTQPTEPPPTRTTEPGVPSCQLACSVNPFTAPPECDCTTIATGSGGGGGTTAAGPTLTPESIAEDGEVSVAELLDYFEQLYRARIAGVQNLDFIERVVVGQNQQAARSRRGFGIVLASARQSPGPSVPGPENTIAGVDTLLPRIRRFNKTTESGYPALQEETPQEKAERQANEPEFLAQADPEMAAAAKALANDPALFFDALGGLADLLAGGGAGDGLRRSGLEMRAQLLADQQVESDEFSDDVLGELLRLKEAQKLEAWTGPVPSMLHVGVFYKHELRFELGSPCSTRTSCTAADFTRFIGPAWAKFKNAKNDVEDLGLDTDHMEMEVCIVWRPSPKALAAFSLPQEPQLESQTQPDGTTAPPVGQAVVNAATSAELWLPLQDWVQKLLIQNYVSSADNGPDSDASALAYSQEYVDPNRVTKDRPIRMKLEFLAPSSFGGFEPMVLDRVYMDFEEAGPLFEPRRVRTEMSDAAESVKHVVDTLRADFRVNEAPESPAEEAERIGRGLGDAVDNLPGGGSNAPQ